MGNSDGVYTSFYEPHLQGVFASNTANNQMELTRAMYVRHLTELCVNRFEWTGLPDEIDPRFLELNLYWRALAVFFKHKATDKFMALQAAGAGLMNVQDVPTHFRVLSPNILIDEQLESGTDCVPIWANYLRVPELDKVNLYAMKLAQLDRTIEINSSNMRNTKIVAVPDTQTLSAKNMVQQMAEGVPTVFGVKAMNELQDSISVMDLAGPSGQLTELWDAKSHMWNECMTMLGINNANQDKKERLVASEVSANDEQVESTRYIALNARQFAAKQINDLYGLDVWVDFRRPPTPEIVEPELEDEDDIEEDNDDTGLKVVS